MIRQNPFRKESARVVRASIRDEIIAPQGWTRASCSVRIPGLPHGRTTDVLEYS